MGLLDKVKDAMHSNNNTESTTSSGNFNSNVDETNNRSSVDAVGADLQESRARRRAEESAALGGNSSMTAGNTTTGNTSTGQAFDNNTATSGTTGSNFSQTQAVPQSDRADYADIPGHQHTHQDTNIDPLGPNTTNTTTTLNHVTHENVLRNEVEEVQRVREQDRHVTHIQLHEQPIIDRQVNDEVHHNRTVAPTEVVETHSAAPGESALLTQQVGVHQDTREEGPTTRTVVDNGEVLNTTTHHTIHNVVQPIIEREVVDQHRIHTVIPIHETIYTAPVVHQASQHAKLTMDQFTEAGGVLGSGINHESVIQKVIDRENCERTVDGPAETLMEKLHLKSASPTSNNFATTGNTNTGTPTSNNFATTGNTNTGTPTSNGFATAGNTNIGNTSTTV